MLGKNIRKLFILTPRLLAKGGNIIQLFSFINQFIAYK